MGPARLPKAKASLLRVEGLATLKTMVVLAPFDDDRVAPSFAVEAGQ